MGEMLQVKIGESAKAYPVGTSYKDIAREWQAQYQEEIVLVFVDERLQELNSELKADCEIKFVTVEDAMGYRTYQRSLSFLLVKAMHDVGKPALKKVRIHFSVGNGYYCTAEGEQEISESFLIQVKARMKEMVEADLPIQKQSVHTEDAIKIFREQGMTEKEKLFNFRRVSNTNLYELDGFKDYYYGYMLPSTGYLKYFELYKYDEGLVIQMPARKQPKVVPSFTPQEKLFQILKESTRWADIQDIETVGDLNEAVTKGDLGELILVQEAMQERKIAEIAAQIVEKKDKIKFILIAGPSSSGKTTFSHRLSIQLRTNGIVPHPIAVDNYFVDREFTPIDADGKLNFESLEAVDLEMFNRDMQALLKGKEVVIPTFNFKTGIKEFHRQPQTLGKNDMLVIEGIHCLNDKMTYRLNAENKFKIYISALTQVNVDEHNRIPSTDGRMIRRIVRDARTRALPAQATIAMWNSVRRGEDKNIFPYQESADIMFNSALIYELAVLKPYIETALFGIDKSCEEYQEAKRLLKFLDYFVGIGSEKVPKNSLLREFIDGGCFQI